MTLSTLIIARHGNTFLPEEAPRRVGLQTDIPLVAKGHVQAHALGLYLRTHNLKPDNIVTSELIRTRQTAELASFALGIDIPIQPTDVFNEIDYGPDENKLEADVIARIGERALQDWELEGKMPDGWSPSPEKIRKTWSDFASAMIAHYAGQKTLVVTSNGIARFALDLTGDWEHARQKYGLKLATGALGILTRRPDDPYWTVIGWNIRPEAQG